MLPGDVRKRLKISFDSLDYEQKQVFMDVACFFIGEKKTMAMTIWEGSGWSSHHALEALKDKCLLEEVDTTPVRLPGNLSLVDFKPKSIWQDRFALKMHDHLRDLGREMANELSHPCRVWQSQHLKSLELKGLQNILAQTKGRCFHSIWDKSMDCKITYFIGEPEDSSDTSLLWLRLEYNRSKGSIKPSIPSWIPLQNVQCIRIINGCFQRLWQRDMKAPSHLKELRILRSSLKELKEFPDLSGKSTNMKVAVLDAKKFQMDVWSSVESLGTNLRSLFVMGSKLTGDLASDIAEGATCKSLVIYDFKLPREEELALNNDRWSRTIMSGIENLKIEGRNLVTKISVTGNCIQRLQSLKICEMENLIEADLARINTSNYLEITNCEKLKRLSGIPDLTNLTGLYIKECPELEELPCLASLSYLEDIKIEHCEKLENITLPAKVIGLSVQRCKHLQRVLVTVDLTKFTRLNIDECPELEDLPSFLKLTCLEQIHFYYCEKVDNIPLPPTLIVLSLRSCRNLRRIVVNGEFTKLRQLYIEECPQLEEFPSLVSVSCLEEIENDSCEKIENIILPTTLNSLSVQSCKKLQRIAVNGDLTKLRQLYIEEYPELQELPNLARVSCLEEIEIDSCEKLQNISELHVSEYLKLSYCSTAVIRNRIHKLKSVLRKLGMIGRAVDGAVSSLNKDLFSDANIGVDGVIEIGLHKTSCDNWSELSAIIICFVVVVNNSNPVQDIYK